LLSGRERQILVNLTAHVNPSNTCRLRLEYSGRFNAARDDQLCESVAPFLPMAWLKGGGVRRRLLSSEQKVASEPAMIDRAVCHIRQRASIARLAAASLFVIAIALIAAAPVCVAQSSQNTAAAQQQTGGCAAGNGGITLSPGFCATVFADNLGHARQMAFGPNGVLYVNTWSGTYYHNDKVPPGGFLIALRDTQGNGHADQIERFGPGQAQGSAGGTGLRVYKNGIYAEQNDKIIRYPLPVDGIAPKESPQVIVSGLPLTGDHPMHPFAIDDGGGLFVDLGSATNSCQFQNRMPNSPGREPCTELETRAGTWLYDANKKDQHFSPVERYATGLRNGEGLAFDPAGRLFVTQHGRDQLSQNWPRYFNAQQSAELPAEEIVLLQKGADYGWPECYYDQIQSKLVLAPEYGGDGRQVGGCASKLTPVAAFPGHWAPNDLLIYAGKAFPDGYQGGAFVAFHGSWNRAPEPQGGYNVVFQPLADGRSAGPFIVFADGFAGAVKEPGRAAFRPSGLAMGPDGALYISEDVHGRIWRVTYHGAADAASAPAPPPKVAGRTSGASGPPEGTHPDAGRAVLASLPVPAGATAAQVARGERIFHGEVADGTCAGCHGSDANGSPQGPSLVSGKWLDTDGSFASLQRTITDGVSKPKNSSPPMPPRGGAPLSDADVAAVAAYVWAISHPDGK
jgi:glucose/arabinose dehydrogenase/mono/diheme cytochrome c family protein